MEIQTQIAAIKAATQGVQVREPLASALEALRDNGFSTLIPDDGTYTLMQIEDGYRCIIPQKVTHYEAGETINETIHIELPTAMTGFVGLVYVAVGDLVYPATVLYNGTHLYVSYDMGTADAATDVTVLAATLFITTT